MHYVILFAIFYALCLYMYTGVSAEPLPRAPCEGDDRVQDLFGHTGPGISRCRCM